MVNFPTLKTGAIAQYPAGKSFRFQNRILRFIDGTDQRYRELAGPLRMWEIRLDKLDEGEMADIELFFLENQGSFGDFAFTDPWDGQVYSNCSLATDSISLTSLDELQGSVALRILENRS